MKDEFYFTIDLVRDLKPNSAKILLLLILSAQPQNAKYLEDFSQLSDKTVAKALRDLEHRRLVTRNGRYSWQLSTYATQLPLMAQTRLEPPAGADEACDPSPIALTGAPAGPVAGDDPESNASEEKGESENFRLGISDSSSSSRSLIKDSKNPVKDLPLASRPDPEILRVLLAAMDEWGIREPARSDIARMPGMTLARIDYHCGTRDNSGHVIPRGQAIYRIKNNWPYKETDEYEDPVPGGDY
jgi:hypothetical protein